MTSKNSHWLALLPPVIAFALQSLFWSWLQPFVWFLFYPAIFFSSWIGGMRGGIRGTVLSTILVWYCFLPPQMSFAVEHPRAILSVAVFIGMGVLFSVFHERLRMTTAQLSEAMTHIKAANDALEARVMARTTELAASKESIEMNEARLGGIVTSAMDAIISVDSDQIVILFNAAAEAMFRCPPGDALGQPLDKFIPERFRDTHRTHIHAFGQTGVTSRSMKSLGSLTGIRSGGEEFPIEASISQVDVAGQKTYTVILRDITERKHEEGRSSLLAAIVESSADAIVGKDLNGIVTSWNSGAERMFGYPANEMVGHSITKIIPQDMMGEEELILSRIRRGERVKHFETMRRVSDGSTISVSVTVSPIRDGEGRIVGASKVARNITERLLAEAALRESERRFSDLVRNIQMVSVMLDRNASLTFCNEYFLQLTGWKEDEVLGKDWFKTFVPTEQTSTKQVFSQVLAGLPAVTHHENEILTRNGERRLIRWCNTLLRSPADEVIGTSSIGEDITERRRVEHSLRIKQMHSQSLLRLARGLESTVTTADILRVMHEELEATLGFKAVWLYLFSEDHSHLRLVKAEGRGADQVADDDGNMLLIKGDLMLEEIAAAEDLVVVEDAQTDPRTDKCVVGKLGSRTIVNMPVIISGKTLGTIGCGTFGEEGVRPLTEEDRAYFKAFASHVAAVFGRVQSMEKRQLAEVALRESEELFSAAFRSSPAAIAINRRRDLVNIEVNDSFLTMFDCTREDIVGHTLIETGLMGHETLQMLKSRLDSMGQIFNEEIEVRTLRGKPLHINLSIKTIQLHGESCSLSILIDVTERHRADEEREKLMRLVQHSRDLIAMADLNGRITFMNAGGRKMIGLQDSQDPGELTFTDYVPEPWHDFFRNTVVRTAKETGLWEGEMQLRNMSTGALIDVIRSTFLLRDAAGQPNCFATVTRDVTAAKQAEAALREKDAQLHESDRRLADIVHGMTEACFALDAGWRFTFVNDRGESLLHHRREEMLGRPIWEVFHKLVGTPMEAQYRRAMNGRMPLAFEAHSPIAERWLDIRLFPSGDGLAAFLLDIDARKRSEEALRESEARFRGTLDSMMEGCQIIDREWRYLYVNEVAALHGRRPVSELLGRTMMECYPGIETTPMAAAIKRCMDDHQTELMENAFTYPDGSSAVFQLGIQSVPEGVFVLSLDITARKMAEERINQMNAELEQRVLERTAQLEAANEELESFSYSVSHDLRAPLRAMDGFSRAVMEDYGPQLPEEGARYLQVIRSSTQRMGNLIDDLLTFSRLSRLPLNKRTIDTNALVQSALHELSSQREGRNLDLNIAHLPSCEGDPALLKQVWINLLSNAIKYTRKREHAVAHVGCEKDGDRNIFFIRDNGTGFDMRYANKLFGVFQRLHRAEEYDGTGVGLAIVQRVIRRHGGSVWAEAEPDKGATFYFTIEQTERS